MLASLCLKYGHMDNIFSTHQSCFPHVLAKGAAPQYIFIFQAWFINLIKRVYPLVNFLFLADHVYRAPDDLSVPTFCTNWRCGNGEQRADSRIIPFSRRRENFQKPHKNKVIHISQYLILLNKETVEDHFTLNLKLKQGAVESCHVVEKMVFLKYLDKFSLKLEKFSNISRWIPTWCVKSKL